MAGVMFVSNLITPTYRREGDLDGRYNPQAYNGVYCNGQVSA